MKNRTANKIISFSLCLSAIFAGSTIYYANRSGQYETAINYSNERAYSQLLSSITSLDGALQKVQYVSSGPLLNALAAEIWQESESAKGALSILPLDNIRMEKTQKFIAQTGDYAYNILKMSANGLPVSAEQRQALAGMIPIADNMSNDFKELKAQLDQGGLSYGGITEASFLTSQDSPEPATLSYTMNNMEEEFPSYASLVYDGPFSDHINQQTPRLTENLKDVDKQQALQAASTFLGVSADALQLSYESDSVIPSYCFSMTDGTSIEVTKKGGIVCSLSKPTNDQDSSLSADKAVDIARQYLKDHGFGDMKESYYTIAHNNITINFAFTQNGITVYPDLIKVKVSLASGGITGLEAKGYVMNHTSRTLTAPSVSVSKAKKALSDTVSIKSEDMALIPTAGKKEVLCYEFLCETESGNQMLMYVNSTTGAIENILILLIDDNGTLTI